MATCSICGARVVGSFWDWGKTVVCEQCDALERQARRHADILQESLTIARTTANPDTRMSRYDVALNALEQLIQYEKQGISTIGPPASEAIKAIRKERREEESKIRLRGRTVADRLHGVPSTESLFDAELLVATLDGQTCMQCRSLDGKHFPIGEGPIPPLHSGCRCLRVAYLGEPIGTRPSVPVTEKMLLREYTAQSDIGRVSKRADLPRGHKGKFDAFARQRKRELIGRVPAKTTYQDWLKCQSAEFQDEVLNNN